MSRIQDRTQSKTDALNVLSLFEQLSQQYAAILNPDHPKWNSYGKDARKSIVVINLLNITQIRPVMLAVSKYFASRNTPASFKTMVSWSVRFLILNIRGGRLDDGYAKLAHKIYNGDIKSQEQLKTEAEGIVIKDNDFKIAFETANVGVSKLARYYLRSIEITASQQSDPEFIPNNDVVINLEHIMPASYDKDKWPHIKKSDAEAYLNRIGEYVFTSS